MPRILVAGDRIEIAAVERILGPGHELVAAAGFETAVAKLQEASFDLILIGVFFDDSRMFELLPLTRFGKNEATPVICFCTRDTEMTRTMHKSIGITSHAFGAWMYLEQHAYNVQQDPDAEIRRVIERCLTDEASRANLAKRVDIQAQRGDLMQLRLSLEAEEWSQELEDRLGDLRIKLARVLLELSKLQVNHITLQEQLAISRALKDRVSEAVDSDI